MHAESATSGRIFISYRRDETAYAAGWLFDRLTERFGPGSVFKDVDSIEFGDDFAEAIATAVTSCDVLLALIGERWSKLTDEQGRRRLDFADDFVRREIEAALTRDVRVIPILVDRARMPSADELPPSLTPLVGRQALEIDPSRFASDTTRLIAVVEKTLGEKRTPSGRAGAAPTRRRWAPAALAVAAAAAVTAFALAASDRTGLGTGGSSAPDTAAQTAPMRAPGTASPAASATSTPGAADQAPVILADDFSSDADGWTVLGTSAAGGRVADGTYRVHVAPATGGAGGGAFPVAATNIYPVAPADVVVEVTGTRLTSSEPQMEYGIMCRANKDTGHGYFLTLSNRYAEIAKSSASAEFEQLARTPLQVDAGVPYKLRAECGSEAGDAGVHLSLSIDDRPLGEYVDRANPLTEGCVGLWIGVDATARRTGEAEFDDFAVRG
jgi:hypothetical protein